ncbi:piggyBac transposable element-derived protein 3-like [Gordionus sp. m RMFG-2023]|uniref:piggyBac transposable element-derived protein 3-like n=1 Tax=Gordionus sp. m RMFG-2023 TaxID=3053472 RepID=UPI0031FCCE08
MTLNRWEQIKSFIHINDNDKFIPLGSEGHDPLHKIRPLITITNNILKSLSIGENICVDEQIIPYKGMSRLKQYNPQKPKKWGYKVFLLCGDDGLLHNFEVYSGKILPAEGLPDVGASGNAVLRLISYIPQQINYKLFFDNWFCSPNLQVVLAQRGIFCAATVRGNRLPNINFPTDKELKKKGRGFFVSKKTIINGVELNSVKWHDNRAVTLLSTFVGAHPLIDCERYDRKKRIK